jgi:hypothetical protein
MSIEDILVSYADFKWMFWDEDTVQRRGVKWTFFSHLDFLVLKL